MTDKPTVDLSSLEYVDYGAPEILCNGPFYVQPGLLSVITFTNGRPKAEPLLKEGKTEIQQVIVARIIVTGDGLIAMRDLLNRLLPVGQTQKPDITTAGGGTATVH